ncbi:hypothetical protein SprV_0902785600 [Sparganum proliferum]
MRARPCQPTAPAPAFSLVDSVLTLGSALLGALLKFAPNVYQQLLSKLLDNVTQEDAKKIMIFIGENSGPAALVLLLVGASVGAFCFFGLFAATCHCEKGFKVYAVILGVITVIQAVGVGYIFGDPQQLPNTVLDIMKKALGAYGKGDITSSGATLVWQMLMTSDNEYCCGLKDYKDFGGLQELPQACCYKGGQNTGKSTASSHSPPAKCDLEAAKKANVKGCEGKIMTFLKEEKTKFLIAPVLLIVVQAAVFALAIFAICTKAL